MSASSVKQRLILALQRELDAADTPEERDLLALDIYRLGNRGSCPLPAWARSAARARGIA